MRTRALNFGRNHWKMVAAWVIAGASTLVNISMTLGHKQADQVYSTQAIQRIESKVDGLVTDVQTIKTEQASAKMAQQDLGDRIGRMEGNWDNAFQHAGDTPRARSHRAR